MLVERGAAGDADRAVEMLHTARDFLARGGTPEDESICVFAVMGDKNTSDGLQGSDWYDEAVPIVDAVWRQVLAEG